MKLRNFFNPLHIRTKRNYIDRMQNNKADCMATARKFDKHFFDGERRFGYGGYKYIEGLLTPMAHEILKVYEIKDNSKVLDAGCGKGFLLYEMKKIKPSIQVVGYDCSSYAIENCKSELRGNLFVHKAENISKFKDNEFDFAMTLGTFHNLNLRPLISAIKEFVRVSKKQYLMVESYRNEKELFNLQCWALTCNAFYSPDDWKYIFDIAGYEGDYEFIYFE